MEPSAEERLRQSAHDISVSSTTDRVKKHESIKSSQSVKDMSEHSPPVKRKLLLIITILSLALFLVGIGFMGVIVYAPVDFPFLTNGMEKSIHMFMYKIPLLPKTPKQILLVASESRAIITKYNPEFSISGTVSNTAVPLATFDMKIAGPIDISPESDMQFDLLAGGSVSFAGTSYQANGTVRKSDDVIYGKINNISNSILDFYTGYSPMGITGSGSIKQADSTAEIAANLKRVFEHWVMYDMSTIESETRTTLQQRSADQSLIETTRRDAQRVLLDASIIDDVVRKKDEVVKGIDTYHLQYAPDNTNLRSTLRIVYELGKERNKNTSSMTDEEMNSAIEKIVQSVQMLTVDVWIGKHDAILRRISVQSDIAVPDLFNITSGSVNSTYNTSGLNEMIASQLADITLSTSMVLTIRDIGKDVVVEAPLTSLSPAEFGTMLQNALVTEAQRKAQAVQQQYRDDFTVFRDHLTIYFAKNFVFPVSLADLPELQLLKTMVSEMPSASSSAQSPDTTDRLSQYMYQRSTDGQAYVLYVEKIPTTYAQSGSTLPLYGITSQYAYPHQLTTEDLQLLQITPNPTVTLAP